MPPRNPLQEPHVDGVRRGPDLGCYECTYEPTTCADLVCHETMSGPTLAYRPADCWCLQQCTTPACNNTPRKRKAAREPDAPFREPPLHHHQLGDRTWVQHVTVWHPGDFTSSRVEMRCDLAMRDIFRELCADLRIERSQVQFVWRSATRRHRALADHDAPCYVGMREGHDECIECEYI